MEKWITLKATQMQAAPQVAYLIPLFQTTITSPVTNKKFIGARIYLKRLWYSSGYYEKLAVMLYTLPPSQNADLYYILSTIGRQVIDWLICI
jgi:hypothetical protein